MIPPSTPSGTQNANRPKVHPVGRVSPDGRVFCPCDEFAVRLVSRTDANPGRAFYCCPHRKCGFWKWEDELKPPAPPAPPQTPQSSQLPLSPPSTQTPAKRPHAHMSTGSRPAPGSGRRNESPGARARRLAMLQAACEERDRELNAAQLSPSAPTVHDVSSNESDEDGADRPVRGESDSRNNKRARFDTVKAEVEDEQPLVPQIPMTPPRRSPASTFATLPTPSQTFDRERNRGGASEIDDFFNSVGPASPTLFTRGAQRALERVQNNALASGSSFSSRNSRYSQSVVQKDSATNANANANEGPKAEETTPESSALRSTNAGGEGNPPEQMQQSFPAQLASTIERMNSQVPSIPNPSLPNGSSGSGSSLSQAHSVAVNTMLTALSTITAQQATLQTALRDFISENERLQGKLADVERRGECKDKQIAKLQGEIAHLRSRNIELEAFRDQIQSVAQSTPPRQLQ